MTMPDPVTTYERKFGMYAVLGAGVWLVFLAPAVQEGWRERGAFVGWVGLASVFAFAGVYMWSFIWGRPRRRTGDLSRRLDARASLIYLALVALAVVMVLTLHSSALGSAVYLAVAGIMLFPVRLAVPIAVVLAAVAELLARKVAGWEGADGIALSVGLATFAVWGIWQAMRRSMELALSREENAELAIGQERARMARDLHDILGHSLTVIAVKAELAGRLLEVNPGRVRSEVADIERLSRDALADVRRTVEGYHELSLPVEITRARAALEAAEIDAALPGSTDEVPSEWRELFAWTIREGVTNVVRHSGARHCTVSLGADRLRITDDGRGCTRVAVHGNEFGGHGLSGLRERAAGVGASIVTETPPGGGFCLTVSAPEVASTVPSTPVRARSERSTSVPSTAAPSRTVPSTSGRSTSVASTAVPSGTVPSTSGQAREASR